MNIGTSLNKLGILFHECDYRETAQNLRELDNQ